MIRCDGVGFTELDPSHKMIFAEQWTEDPAEPFIDLDNDHEPDLPIWTLWRDFLPCSYGERTGDLARVIMYSDFYALAELRNTATYAAMMQSAGYLHRMTVRLPAAPGRTRRILLDRGPGPDFSERDRLVLQLLRPHLYEVYLDAQRRQNRVPRLSCRELQVLRLAGQGWSNADIARELFIKVGTVRKHMEHIFDRTGVRSRAGAAALVMPHLGPAGPYWAP